MRTSKALNGLKYYGTGALALTCLAVMVISYFAIIYIISFMLTVVLFSLLGLVMR